MPAWVILAPGGCQPEGILLLLLLAARLPLQGLMLFPLPGLLSWRPGGSLRLLKEGGVGGESPLRAGAEAGVEGAGRGAASPSPPGGGAEAWGGRCGG